MNNNEWKKARLGDLCNVSMGKTPSRSNKDFWDPSKSTNNVWVSIADLTAVQGKEISNSKEYVSDSGAKLFKAVPKGTLLASFKLSLGKLAFAGTELRTNEAIAAFKNDESEVLNEYLYFFLTFFDWNDYAKEDHKVKGKTLNKEKVENIEIYFPNDKKEQKRIVEILDEKFGAIEELKQVTDQQIADAKELFESRLNETVLSSNSQKWKTCEIGKVVDLKQGLAINSKTKYLINPNGSLPLLRIKDLKEKTEEIFIDGDKTSKEVHVYPDDVIYTRTGQVGLVFRGFRGILHNNSFKVTPEPSVSRQYLFWYLQSKKFFEQVTNFAKRAAQPDISHKSFKTILISFPESLKEQEAIAKELDKLLEKTKELEAIFRRKITDLDELKKSYLEQAFSGKL